MSQSNRPTRHTTHATHNAATGPVADAAGIKEPAEESALGAEDFPEVDRTVPEGATAPEGIPLTPMSAAPSAEMKALMDMVLEARKEAAEGRAARVQLELQVRELVERQATVDTGAIKIMQIHCNTCGAHCPDGKKCPRHPNDKVNHVGLVNEVHTGRVIRAIVKTT